MLEKKKKNEKERKAAAASFLLCPKGPKGVSQERYKCFSLL